MLDKFCSEWGLEVNELKTNVMVFGDDKNSKAKYDQHFKYAKFRSRQNGFCTVVGGSVECPTVKMYATCQ